MGNWIENNKSLHVPLRTKGVKSSSDFSRFLTFVWNLFGTATEMKVVLLTFFSDTFCCKFRYFMLMPIKRSSDF